ncbi:MAG: hypothetical protein CMP53_06010 [Flavobacteriales bacterium]|nr:hypothetical protein [Flavobacteriales bacterium]
MCYFSSMKQRIPAFLKPGDLIGLSATARFATQEMIDTATEFIEKAGFRVHFEDDILFREGQVAGSIAQRIQSFNKLIDHKGIKAIWNVRGGYGSADIVDAVDWSSLKKHPKWLVGFSDFTTFLLHAHQHDIPTVHAAMPISFENTTNDHLNDTFRVLSHGPQPLELKEDHGHCRGTLIGGNLSVIFSIYGTPSLPSLKNAILLLEDLDEYHYHLDRMLLSLKRQGAFKGLRGVLLGQFSDIHDHDIPWGTEVEKTLRKYFDELSIPVLTNLPFGHTSQQFPLVIGSSAEVNKNQIEFKL